MPSKLPQHTVLAVAAAALFAGSAMAQTAAAPSPEEFRYSWRLRGVLSWIAGLKFPVSGVGALRNVPMTGDRVESELVIRGRENEGRYVYRSEISSESLRTLMTYHGYEWDGRKRNEETRFDYEDGIARIRKERENEGAKTRIEQLPAADLRDVLTGIHFLRKKADEIRSPLISTIYSDGDVYPIVFKPLGARSVPFQGKLVAARGFEISAAPGNEKKWPGGVKVWLSADGRSIPLRIEIQRSLASFHLELEGIH